MAKAAFRILLFFQAPTFSSFLSLSDTFVQCQLWMVGPNAFACRHEEWELAIDAPHGESLREGAAWTSRLSVECVRREKSLACDDGASFFCFLFFCHVSQCLSCGLLIYVLWFNSDTCMHLSVTINMPRTGLRSQMTRF